LPKPQGGVKIKAKYGKEKKKGTGIIHGKARGL
jgi:hypothetical protein